jgi:hypothetical protein
LRIAVLADICKVVFITKLARSLVGDGFSLSIFTLEIAGRPTVALCANRHGEAERIFSEDWLRSDLSTLRSAGVPLWVAGATTKVRLARPDEAAFYRDAAGAVTSSDKTNLVYLLELDENNRGSENS